MNYYNPNFYQNYPYANQQIQQMPPQYPTQSTVQYLNGKIVDSEDIVRATEVPIGGYGVFPRADFNEIYLKKWEPNGTTSIITYHAEKHPSPKQEPDYDSIIARISALEEKFNSLSSIDKEKKEGVVF